MKRFVVPTIQDLDAVARCHRAAFPKALSTAMGQQYVMKMLEWYIADERAFIFFLTEDERCVGYCGGLKFTGIPRMGSASSMIQYSYNQAVKTFLLRPWLFLHPEFITKYKLAFRNLIKRIRRLLGIEENVQITPDQRPVEPHTGLVVIGVDPQVHSKGYGSLLLQEFERFSSDLGFAKMSLTVRTDNNRAIKSYLRNGWITSRVDGNSTSMEKRIT